ncbi:phage terminase small subunit [Domibacillus sp. A3M-37]|uniref:phage terminase small subunit n=1 Tax=Domibacillus sp. A3M-37 TaxID=2962037 RepID=UPI0020B68E73|nr:phage terminase small subunit [Domibacillus sp. A3M-37]MCP3764080.1 phage terminase small subunit [Domibacillus sp. A3M-37]
MANWEDIRAEWETTKITLAALAEKHDIKLGTLKSRKSREGWSRDPTKKDATKSEKVATIKQKDAIKKKHGGQPGNKGNPKPATKFPKRNKAAEKHGLFSKFLPDEAKEIMDAMTDLSAADLIWQQVQILFAAIIRSQQIMWVNDKGEMIKELKKAKYEYYPQEEGGFEKSVTEEEHEFQFAWDRQATFLNAQSRAMGELRSLIKKFDELAHIHDERRLKLEQMRVAIDKTKAEVEKLSGNTNEGPIEIMISRKKRDE